MTNGSNTLLSSVELLRHMYDFKIYLFLMGQSYSLVLFLELILCLCRVHSQGRARKTERVGGPHEPGELVWDSRVPCEGV